MNTLFTGRKIIELPHTGSTNSYTIDLLKTAVLPEGTWVIAHEQKQGRGQMGNSWESEAGMNITASLVLYPAFLSIEKQFQLSKIISLAICSLLEKNLGPGAGTRIKWPNDIYAGTHKIAGMLIENSVRAGQLQYSVVGIGLNVNQEKFSAALSNATSMVRIAGKKFSLQGLLEELSALIEARYLQLRAGKSEAIDAAYLELLYRYKIPGPFILRGKPVSATITGISESGKLQLELQNGNKAEAGLKEVEFVQ